MRVGRVPARTAVSQSEGLSAGHPMQSRDLRFVPNDGCCLSGNRKSYYRSGGAAPCAEPAAVSSRRNANGNILVKPEWNYGTQEP